MKFMSLILTCAIVLLAGTAIAEPSDLAVREDECAGLGGPLIIAEKDLPPGAKLSEVRKCRDHPLGDAAAHAPKIVHRDLSKANACWFGQNMGCKKGYCWKTCGWHGQWCWMARNGGTGSWWSCDSDAQCQQTTAKIDADCGWGKCKSCGCSC